MITLQHLEKVLGFAANILRGKLDTIDSFNLLVRLLLLKRLCDVFEEANMIEKTTDNDELVYSIPSSHRFFIPNDALWKNLNLAYRYSYSYPCIGNAFNEAVSHIEAKNKELYKVFTSFDFNKIYKRLGYQDGNETLHQLIMEFSHLNLQNSNLAELHLLGKASNFLIENFVANSVKDVGMYYTPQNLTELLVRLIDIQKGMSVCDPTCGIGGFLVACANRVRNLEEKSNDVLLYGQEKDFNIWAIAKINLLLHDIFDDCDIQWGDTIRDPKLLQDNKLMLFDRVIADLPFGAEKSGYEFDYFDYNSRFRYGIPPKYSTEFAIIQHILATLKETGKAGVIVTLGVLFRSGKEGLIRQRIVEDDLIEAVIGLPANLLYGTGILTAILIFNRKKVEERKNKILFIDASNQYEKSRSKNYLRLEDINHIVTAYQAFVDEQGYAKVVTLEDLAANDYMLNINRYILPCNLEKKEIDIETELFKLRELEAKRTLAENDMNKYLRELGINI